MQDLHTEGAQPKTSRSSHRHTHACTHARWHARTEAGRSKTAGVCMCVCVFQQQVHSEIRARTGERTRSTRNGQRSVHRTISPATLVYHNKNSRCSRRHRAHDGLMVGWFRRRNICTYVMHVLFAFKVIAHTHAAERGPQIANEYRHTTHTQGLNDGRWYSTR